MQAALALALLRCNTDSRRLLPCRAKLGRAPDPAPRWLGNALAWLLGLVGPKGLEFAKYSIGAKEGGGEQLSRAAGQVGECGGGQPLPLTPNPTRPTPALLSFSPPRLPLPAQLHPRHAALGSQACSAAPA